MQIVETGGPGARTLVLALDPDEPVVETLKAVARDRDIRGAWLSALGAVRDAELAWFDTAERRYRTRRFPEILELVSCTGNLSRAGDEPVVHAHACGAPRDLAAVAGHLVEAVCAVTVEIRLEEIPVPLSREPEPRFGLRLLRLPERG